MLIYTENFLKIFIGHENIGSRYVEKVISYIVISYIKFRN